MRRGMVNGFPVNLPSGASVTANHGVRSFGRFADLSVKTAFFQRQRGRQWGQPSIVVSLAHTSFW